MTAGPGEIQPKSLNILGIRGLPAQHGGFETFAEHLAVYLVARGWKVTVYCQANESGVDSWQGILLRKIKAPPGAGGSVLFDARSIVDATNRGGLTLVLGYNTAVFNLYMNVHGVRYIVNMDGIEWQRRKWGRLWKVWFWANERVACKFAWHLIADHPTIEKHLRRRGLRSSITMIPYGADSIDRKEPKPAEKAGPLDRYALIVARPEPENSILEMVRAWSRRPRSGRLVVLGSYDKGVPYQAEVLAAAGPQVDFMGPIYDAATLQQLRANCLFFMYGHTVGGTSPTLVEALGAASPVVALDTPYSRWVAGRGARYFSSELECDSTISALLDDPEQLQAMSQESQTRHEILFTWDAVLAAYEDLLEIGIEHA